MERLLTNIEKASDSKNVPRLVEAVYVAKESLKIPAVPIPEKRKKCFVIFDSVLNSNKQKLVPLAIEGLQFLLRDATLISESATKRPEDSLCSQMLRCFKQLPNWDKQFQCQILTILVQLISLNEVVVNLNDVHEALQICSQTFASEETSVRLAVRAAITQMLNSFCSNRHQKVFRQASIDSEAGQTNHNQDEIAIFMEMQALLSKVHEKLAAAQTAEDLQLALDTIYSILSAQPGNCCKYMPLYNVLSTELVPSMLCLLHSADEKPAPSKSLLSRTPTTPSSLSVFNSPELARSFYQVVEQLIRLLSRAAEAEPMVLELLRTAIVFPSVPKRGEALKLLKRLFSTSARFLEFLDLCAKEPQFWPLILSCLEECVKQGLMETAIDAVKATGALFTGLNSQLSPSLMDQHNSLVFEILKTASNAKGHGRVGAGMIQISRQRKKERLNEESAKIFVVKLKENVKTWSEIDVAEDVDKKIMVFSYCISNELSNLEPEDGESPVFVNTDTAYLTVYAALSFGLRLKTSEPDKSLFFNQVNQSGCLIYAKDQWFQSIFDFILDVELFEEVESPENTVLGQLLDDYDGYSGRKMSYLCEEKVVKDLKYDYFKQWLRDLFAASWSTVLYLLTKFSLSLDRKNLADKIQIEATEATFEATVSLMHLLMKLELSSEIIWVFERIGEEICLLEELRDFIYQNVGLETKKPWRINRIDALCMGILIDHSIDVGVLSAQSLKYTVRVIEYIVELERYSFRLTKTANTNYDANETSLNGLLAKVSQNELPLATVGRVLDELMLKIDTFLDTASKNLNLHALCHLLKFLCTADEDNLRNIEIKPTKNAIDVIISSCALPRISRIVTASIHGRPQSHLMRIWGTVKEHLVEAASSKYPVEINRLALTAIYDIVRSMLSTEPAGSTFSKCLFNAYLDIVCFNVCNEETQEHVVSNLASFIEDTPNQLGSGWKPLFGALKAIRISPAKEITGEDEVVYSPLTAANYAVLDVFKKYMEITDVSIVLPTAMEFIHCMVNYLQSTDGLDKLPQDPEAAPSKESQRDTAICTTVFSFIPTFQQRLISYFSNEDTIVVPSLLTRLEHREHAVEYLDQTLMDDKLEELTDLANYLNEDQTFGVDPSKLSYKIARKEVSLPWKEWTDSQKCVAEVLLGFIDELCGLLLTCSRQTLSTLLVQTTDFINTITGSELGINFAIIQLCITVIPALQKWSRRETDGFVPSSQISVSSRNFKQAATFVTDLVGQVISKDSSNPSAEALTYDIFSFFNELLSHPSPFIAGTGSACFRHLVNSYGAEFSEQIWELVCSFLWKGVCLSLVPIRKLVVKFVPNSVDLNGDIGEVHVVVKENCKQIDLTELKIMCHQIFQIDDNKSTEKQSIDCDAEMVKIQFNYVFVFRPKGNEKMAHAERAVSMDEIISGLMSAQALLQLLSQLLVGQCHSSQLGESLTRTMSCSESGKPLATLLSQKQLGVLMACLDGVNSVADEFDVRPALKYLLQKLINGEQPANLYRLSVASKAIKLQTVFELAKQEEPTKEDVAKVSKKQGASNPNYRFIRLIDQLVENAFDQLEELELQLSGKSTLKDRGDFECAPFARSGSHAEDSTPATPISPRPNPFVKKMSVKATNSVESADGLQKTQLSDLDLRAIAQSEIVAILIERVAVEEATVFRNFLPLFLPKIRKLMKICPAKRARFACSEFLDRLDKEWEITS
ncbi:unnamed protein product [Bursaphelenchus okinawaensis]|uniref:Mon2/Sec7/BIG1-like HDS domain-containing protein n=1 Tax=Bursaphelenchus okinawaensis TaxID=465554 RepID=A0A811JR15_9BILA|nr:unnamed protein product [Bursaphelenchus okinawaensis]CAG9079097.1 unnamed protein product [Bursaphelenchus okinawaensis]